MNFNIPPDMQEATRLTRAGRLSEASALLRRVLGGGGSADTAPSQAPKRLEPRQLDLRADASEPPQPKAAADPALPNVLRDLMDKFGRSDLVSSLQARLKPNSPSADTVPNGGKFLTRSFSNQAGSRPYKHYIPSTYREDGPALPLIVMLHGCTQSPDDFAAGTQMNVVAEEQGCLVAYPGQTAAANQQKCWNWFQTSDQMRDQGEPSLIAGITREIMSEYRVDPKRVYVAGLSAGGAAAAIMGSTYPELYAGVGVHSGLACGAAHDLQSALHAMKQGGEAKARGGKKGAIVPTIVFHGARDFTVNMRNADQVMAGAGAQTAEGLDVSSEKGLAPGGRSYTRTLHRARTGNIIFEQWRIDGAGHAWMGGSAAGSYTDPRGPDASREMLRFFLQLTPKVAA
jgi:poly(hydroxyalkanoate) depolymerase family esterase